MPLARITLHAGKPAEYLDAISQAVHTSLVETYEMDARDRFQVIEEVAPGRLQFSHDYAGGPRSNDFILVSVISMPRRPSMKAAFYARLVELLAVAPGIRREDVFVVLADQLTLDDISFANGISAAALAKQHRGAG